MNIFINKVGRTDLKRCMKVLKCSYSNVCIIQYDINGLCVNMFKWRNLAMYIL